MKALWNLLFILPLFGFLRSQELVYNIPEGLPDGRFIGSVGLDSSLNLNMSDNDFQNLRYSTLTTGNGYQYITINQTSGNLYTDSVWDRETICPYSPVCKLSLDVTVQSSLTSFFKKIKTTVFIDDVNDHAPEFSRSQMSLSIVESVLPGTSFTIDGAKDDDRSEQYSLKSYEITPRDVPFTLFFVKKIDGSSIVKLVVDKKLDRETKDSYQLTITARDGGTPARTDTLTVDITISDVNDNAPMLSSSIYNVTVKEDISVGTAVLKLTATDLDIGDNSKIVYRLSNYQSDEIKQLFYMNETSGELKIKSQLSYVIDSTYKVIVEASDSGDRPLMTQTVVLVTVIDTGNNPPEIIVSLLTDSVARISEYAPFGYVVAHISVKDQDSGYNGIVFCRIDNSMFELQSFDINDYKIIVAQPLDREQQSSHNINIVCEDRGTPSLSTETSFVVEVIDINDNSPTFNLQNYFTRIPENNNVGDEILQVTATDYDEGPNAEIRYMLQHTNNTIVQIDSVTGMIRANARYDRERKTRFEFGILATDGGNPSRVGTATVSVIILDVNDNAPQFSENLFIFKLKENRHPGTKLGRLFATDLDLGDNRKIVFSLADGSNYLPFVVYSDGVIKTTTELDRESVKMYNFTAMATDLGRPSLNSTARVNIFVEDENDNNPVIVFPSSTNNTVTIGTGTPPGSVIATVIARDPDEGFGGELTYSFDGYNDTTYFRLFYETGDILLQKSVKEFSGKVFTLNLVVSDQGKPLRRSRQTLRIVIQSKSSDNLNIIIVISLVCVTLVLSAGIILVICIIRRLDANRDSAKKNSNDVNSSANGRINNTNNLNNCETVLTPVITEDAMLETDRKRKEVTFNFSPDVQNVSNGFLYDSKTNRLGRQTSFGDPLGQSFLKLQDDNHSQTSGETNTSDSGRGLSDDENHTNKAQSFQKLKGTLKSKPSMEINLYSNPHAFFPDGREPLSPIDLPRFTAYPPFTTGKNRFNYEAGSSFGTHRPLQTFQYGTKSSSLDEEDSGSTSGIHSMADEFSINRNDSVI